MDIFIKRKHVFSLIFFTTAILFFPTAPMGRIASAEKLDKIIAVVNSDVITEEELNTFMKLSQMDSEESEAQNASPEEKRKRLLERMIEDRLVLQEAKRLGIKPDEKMVDDRIQKIRDQAGGELAFQEALKQEGISLKDLREKLTNQLLVFMAVQQQVREKVVVSPREVTDYYDEHRDEFVAPEQVVVDSIYVASKEALDQATADLSAGKGFDEVAAAYSKKSNLGTVTRGQLKKALEDFIFSLKVDQCSTPFEMDGGYYLFLVKEKNAASSMPLEEVKGRISEKLTNEKMQSRLREWIAGLKEVAYISVRE
jgi:parvulin-like peptidyl-prolyl isomerase